MTKRFSGVRWTACGVCVLGTVGSAFAQTTVPATIVIGVGDPLTGPTIPTGTTVASFTMPFTDTNGAVGFVGTGSGTPTPRFVWRDTGVIWTNALAGAGVLDGLETSSMGVGQCDQFIYSCNMDGATSNDGVWTHAGRLLADSDPAPGIAGKFISFASRPVMAGGAERPAVMAFIAGRADTSTAATNGRIAYICRGTTPADCTPVLQTGGSITDGANTYPLGLSPGPDISFEMDVSDNGLHFGNIVNANYPAGNTASRQCVTHNNQVVVKVGDATGGTASGLYTQLQIVSVNNTGDVLSGGFSGSGIGVLALNGAVILETGDSPAGSYISSFSADGAGISNTGKVLLIATHLDVNLVTSKSIFYGVATADPTTWTRVVSVGDVLDTNGDSVADHELVTLTSPSHRSLDVADNGVIYAQATIRALAGGAARAAILRFCAGCTTNTLCDSIDFNNDGVSPDSGDIDDYLSVFGGGPCSNDPFCNDIDFNNDCVSPDSGDIDALLSVFGGGSC